GLTLASFGPLEKHSQVRDALAVLASERHDYQTLVLDALDELQSLVFSDVCATHGWPSIESPGYGRGYVDADNLWHDCLQAFDFLRRKRGMIILLLAHSAIETVHDPRVPGYTSYQLRLHKRARGLVQDWCDVIGFLAPDLHVQGEEVGFGKK